MENKSTVIIVGATESDEYGNLWISPHGGGDKVKIAKKREQLFPLFEQGKAVMLIWQTYMNKPYVANAKLVEGELPNPPKKPVESERPKPERGTPVSQNKNRAFALSYAKDLVIPSISPEKPLSMGQVKIILRCARLFTKFLDEDLEISDEEMAKIVMELNKS